MSDSSSGIDQDTAGAAYKAAGVDTDAVRSGLVPLFESLRKTWDHRANVELDLGHFANVVDLGQVSVAISTDGVGTKAIVAQLMNRYDTIGIDCVAINVNDVLCVGAEPQAMVDYLAVQRVSERLMAELGKGLYEGAHQARVSIVGGETAQLPELIQGEEEGSGFDLAGTCIGTLEPGTAIIGARIEPGDAIIGLRSSGVHCNGLTLARRAFGLTRDVSRSEKDAALSAYSAELGSTLGEELLRPTEIYVDPVLGMIDAGVDLRGLAHISEDGLLNLPRLQADVGYVIDRLPDPHSIFQLIQAHGDIRDEEMYEVFNMGIGFCAIVPESHADKAIAVARRNGTEAFRIGHTVDDRERAVTLVEQGLHGRRGQGFERIKPPL